MLTPLPGPGIHQTLVEETSEAHEALHRHPVISQLVSDQLSSKLYLKILLAYHGFFSSAENKRQGLQLWHHFALTKQVYNLQRDISAIDLRDNQRKNLPTGLLTGTPPCQKNNEICWMRCQPSSLGVLYVLHGSAFGAKVMSGHLRKNLPDLPHAFFSAGVNRGTWTLLTESFDQVVSNDEDFRCLVSSANETYRQFGEWLMV